MQFRCNSDLHIGVERHKRAEQERAQTSVLVQECERKVLHHILKGFNSMNTIKGDILLKDRDILQFKPSTNSINTFIPKLNYKTHLLK